MTENVIILGAGFSYDAGIPLLGGFIERMWECATRKTIEGKPIRPEILKTLNEALEIRRELDNYHGRVVFDDRNIEDILSMLAFNILGGGKADSNKFKIFTKAISETIELACNVKHTGYRSDGRYTAIKEGDKVYREFWQGIFKWYKKTGSIPTIISFNYDLVLERSLMQILISDENFNPYENPLPFNGVTLDYCYKHFPSKSYLVEYANYNSPRQSQSTGTIISQPAGLDIEKFCKINILKLHGSLNFPTDSKKTASLVTPIDQPYILPPVSNKHSNGAGSQSWKSALNCLREAKNVTFVGYSLPKTDMYMQFFLKAALGPNQDLNKINIFDPVLSKDNQVSLDMKNRFQSCFSEQIRPRLNFNPGQSEYGSKNEQGTTKKFVDILNHTPELILF
ncbi:hypothetical protein QWY82_10230 [Simiduia curdlanivorans]|uniref:SIR2-like domain-containing protein n=1 Tax=Simiduia curdlanivorans TaxID=1492769 RepID=A0ABV8V0M8_9GAMM|nr:hypothetical protein [Simiduia curdlanivorans]MDN3639187.1 hypothetical protein [Simiduia curdlanivorans]